MRRLTTVLLFVAAFAAGAGLFLAARRPAPLLNAFVIGPGGGRLFERCRQAGACSKPVAPRPPALPPRQSPADSDRA